MKLIDTTCNESILFSFFFNLNNFNLRAANYTTFANRKLQSVVWLIRTHDTRWFWWTVVTCTHNFVLFNYFFRAMEFLNQCELLKIEDILPFFQDFVTIDHFKVRISATCLLRRLIYFWNLTIHYRTQHKTFTAPWSNGHWHWHISNQKDS